MTEWKNVKMKYVMVSRSMKTCLKIVNETLPEETELYDLAELIQGFRRLYQNPDPLCFI